MVKDVTSPYMSRELVEHIFADIRSDIIEIKDVGKKTLEQTTVTNGRVTKHDYLFKFAWWALGALWSIILIIVPIFLIFGRMYVEKISQDAALSVLSGIEEKYNIVIEK